MPLKKSNPAKIAGLLAATLWSLLPITSIYTNNVPPFLRMGIALLFSFISYLSYWAVAYKGKVSSKLILPISYITTSVIGIFGATITFVMSLSKEDQIISYVVMNAWPVIAMFLAAIIWNEKLKKIDYLTSFLGLLGILILGTKDASISTKFSSNSGIFLALSNCIIWAWYSVMNKKFSDISADSLGIPILISACLSLACHVISEPMIWPSYNEMFALMVAGIGPWGAATMLWGFALRNGDMKVLLNYGYLAPALGLTWMVIIGYSNFSIRAFIACALIASGGLINNIKIFNNSSK